MRLIGPMRLMRLMGLMWLICLIGSTRLMAQEEQVSQETITVGGNIYGGGNKGYVQGNTTVNVMAGDTLHSVFGGARMADVGGRSFVNIDGEHATDDISISAVYGGNDIAGTIGTSTVPLKTADNITGLTDVLAGTETKETHPTKNAIDDTWNAFVRTSRSTTTTGTGTSAKTVENKWVLIGSVFGGGNGEYYYDNKGETTIGTGENAVTKVTYDVYFSEADKTAGSNPIATIKVDLGKDYLPVLGKTYLEIKGGELAHVYGGGNNATVTNNTTISINNESDDCNQYVEKTMKATGKSKETVMNDLNKMAKLSFFQTNISSFSFNHARVFGGNNKAEMKIRPTWNLQRGVIRDLYSGGNEGDMTWKEGLLLEIDPVETDKLIVENVYGGCRRANVQPLDDNGAPVPTASIQLSDKDAQGKAIYNFPPGFSARTLIRGGQITNVYGGNDVSGHVYGGNAVGIYASVHGNVYGGGNGSYAYTDNDALVSTAARKFIYGDFYYKPETVLEKENLERASRNLSPITFTPGLESVEALNIFRPDAEQVLLRLLGKEDNPTIIHGSVFVGGNSATVKTVMDHPTVELLIGSHVKIDNAFLGNNGENMVRDDIVQLYAGAVDNTGQLAANGGTDYSSLVLTNQNEMNTYMEGAAMSLIPTINFDYDGSNLSDPSKTYQDYTCYIGSFYCGGNVGSMTYPGTNTMDFDAKVVVFDKMVGGCNNANITETLYHKGYQGGILGTIAERTEPDGGGKTEFQTATTHDHNRLVMNINGMRIEPKRWDDTFTSITSGTLTPGKEYYTTDLRSTKFIADGLEKPTEENPYYELTTLGNSLEWNTALWDDSEDDFVADNLINSDDDDRDHARRLLGGNIYGGCYNSGHVNGNVVINVDADVINKSEVFADTIQTAQTDGSGNYIRDKQGHVFFNTSISGNRNAGVILEKQRDDLEVVAMAIFGAGKGEDTEIWGNTTINLNKGYVFQAFGGGEEGLVGKSIGSSNAAAGTYDSATGNYTTNKKLYHYDADYSTTVNLKAAQAIYSHNEPPTNSADIEYIYGGGNEGDVCGDTKVYLGNGRVYDVFGGASDADILGHTEVYIGKQSDGTLKFPWIRDIVYGGNDFSGTIHGINNFTGKVRVETGENAFDVLGKVYKYDATNNADPEVLKANTYVEYLQGRVDTIFGGSYGNYDYNVKYEGDKMPFLTSSFVNIRPETTNSNNFISAVFGGSTGYPSYRDGDKSQDRSYVLIDIPQTMEEFKKTEVFGAGSYNGLGMRTKLDRKLEVKAPGAGASEAATTAYNNYTDYLTNRDNLSAIIDLVRGDIKAAYGGSYNEGVTRNTIINVPNGSTIKIGSIFGGAYGTEILPPCDVYESNVNYMSENARVTGAIYGGNNNERRTLYTKVNIYTPVWSNYDKGYLASVYGAGRGVDTWSEYTEVNLENGAKVYEVYGGGEMGHVLNAQSVQMYMNLYKEGPSNQISTDDPFWKDSDKWTLTNGVHVPKTDALKTRWAKDWKDAWSLGDYYIPTEEFNTYADNASTNLTNVNERAELDDKIAAQLDGKKYNTNVIIKEGATVVNYAYGGGLGSILKDMSGDVYGTTYIALLGGEVKKDLYAAGTAGSVNDLFGVGKYDATDNPNGFTASANAYIQGGTVRNVYGGGWRGNIGHANYTDGKMLYTKEDTIIYEQIPNFYTNDVCTDILGEAHVVIGKLDGDSHINGIPSIRRNVYGGGEGGSIYGTAHLTINNGYIGYSYKNTGTEQAPNYAYVEELDDEEAGDKKLEKYGGNAFGGGYVANSYVDHTDVKMYGGTIRGSLFGGGEIGPVGRGTVKDDTPNVNYPNWRLTNGNAKIYMPGSTHVQLYQGTVKRNVFGGGRGYDNWRGNGYMTKAEQATMDLSSKGYVFGNTEVFIHGGKIGTKERAVSGDGNVFGGGDEGFVYSASGAKSNEDGYYYARSITSYKCKEAYTENETKYTTGQTISLTDYAAIAEGNQSNWEAVYGLTEDCKVIISPYCSVEKIQVLSDITRTEGTETITLYKANEYISAKQFEDNLTAAEKAGEGTVWKYDNEASVEVDGITYYPITAASYANNPEAAFIPTEKLNKLGNSDTKWEKLDETGVEIANAVFAGGNTSTGSDAIYVNTTAVFGNATASVTDVFAKDLITIGEDGVGGLYGDGNLTFVDGYRELNITNYGTDYYNLRQQLTIPEYKRLTDRERAYFELLYKAKNAIDLQYYESKGTHVDETTGKAYKRGQKITETMYGELSTNEKKNWVGAANGEGPKTKHYEKDARITQDDYNLLWEAAQANWELYGFCTLYAGRMINTIQRADFCGVFGSRVVMRGAQDRVPKTVDYTEYTINRVKEVSLNKQYRYDYPDQDADPTLQYGHGNYFGIYNVVNYLGALTSDVNFYEDPRTTSSNEEIYHADGTTTYYQWKKANLGNRKRNNGSSVNEVALASGVWLELLDESTEAKGEKVYGPITGVVELTLINVAPGEGGGYVYAKNEHGERSLSGLNQVTLAAANDDARSYKMYTYADPITPTQAAEQNKEHLITDKNGKNPTDDGYITTYVEGYDPVEPKIQTSGNFVNSLKRIIDDCYPQSGAYYSLGENVAAPAHYWYIRGDYYVYDQYISAYTGSAQAYAENVSIPLTITAESQGKLTLMNIQPNYYAYYDENNIDEKYKSLIDPTAIVMGGTTYKLNDPIDYWTYSHLSGEEQGYFTPQTWVCSNDATYQGTEYKKGEVYNTKPQELYICKDKVTYKDSQNQDVTYYKGTVITVDQYNAITSDDKNNCEAVFNISNAISRDNGFLLTFDWDNPDVWSDYYHQKTGEATYHASSTTFDATQHVTSPSFKFTGSSQVLGQIKYSVGDIIDTKTHNSQVANIATYTDEDQATFDEAYIATATENFTAHGVSYVPNACISEATYNTLTDTEKAKFDKAMLCTSTYEDNSSGDTKYVVAGTTIPLGKEDGTEAGTYNYYLKKDANAAKFFSDGYICTGTGLWGGTLFTGSQNYPAIDFCNLPKSQRKDNQGNDKFTYNYDALDLLVDPNYAGNTNLYGETYATPQSIDYEATYTGTTPLDLGNKTITVKRYDSTQNKYVEGSSYDEDTKKSTIKNGEIISNTDYEQLVNEAVNYSTIVITPTHKPDTTYYVVKTGFQIGDKWYSPGNQMTYADWDDLGEKQANVQLVTFQELTGGTTAVSTNQTYYFCTNKYQAITPVKDIVNPTNSNVHTHDATSWIEVGTIINYEETGDYKGYKNLQNQQRNFSIDGKTPTETSTLYVARDVDINQLSEDKIITAIYYYDYVESDESGSAYEKIREYHVVNVHVHFKSGMPTIGELLPPGTVLPETTVTLNQPTVSKGAYEILGGGWELYADPTSAESHKNGVPFSSSTPVYFYQDGYYVAYYALSYLGKSYSNTVPLSVANYHRMDDVLNIYENEQHERVVDTDNNYMYLNEAVKGNKRNPKVYIKNDTELNKFAEFFNKTHTESSLSDVQDGQNLDFIIDGDINHTGTWTPIANNSGECFQGTIHGDGHTISGLDHSLINHLCKDVYNLGVTGSFTGAGIAEEGAGYVENCWVKSSATALPEGADKTGAVFGNPTASNFEQVVNSYYAESNEALYKSDSKARKMPDKDFYNGTVAYDLNGFYLYKRYNDQENTSGLEYKYYKSGVTNTETGELIPQTGYYAEHPELCSSGYSPNEKKVKYVENRYADGDFRYSGGDPSHTYDQRQFTINEYTGEKTYYPIWPDDYLFFGQNLTYGHVDDSEHQATPSRITSENRVYRAPAYFRNSTMSAAHFNADAVFAQTQKDNANNIAYKGMTAIDFTGYNDVFDGTNGTNKAYGLGLTDGKFYTPLLDNDGLTRFRNIDLTKNLLVYSSDETQTHEAVHAALADHDGVFNNNKIENEYSTTMVKYMDPHDVKGHGVLLTLDTHGKPFYTAKADQLLVDKQDFYAPISYTFDDDHLMWYQRKPDNYVEIAWDESGTTRSTKGWEGVSLPFEAELVTTDQKGEITHFYRKDTSGTFTKGYDSGHEYWLRGFEGVDKDDNTTTDIVEATFLSPLKNNAASTKEDRNTFLWDYYYGTNSAVNKDKNSDDYQNYDTEYYKQARSYKDYPRLAAATPYIIGFPGQQYSEFDLSGEFKVMTALTNPAALNQQLITFASAKGVTINASDEDMTGVSGGEYTFKPSYLNEELENGYYVLNSDGNSYTQLNNEGSGKYNTTGKTYADATAFAAAGELYTDADGKVPAESWANAETTYYTRTSEITKNEVNGVSPSQFAFRPYFKGPGTPTPTPAPRRIVFAGGDNTSLQPDVTEHNGDSDGGLKISVDGRDIVVESTRRDNTTVRITTTSGVGVSTFTIEPGQIIRTTVPMTGVYMVNRKKVMVK